MNVVDLHPEELLDKEVRGELTESERARLEAHLERCATCRFEREARADFADELEADGAPISVQHLLALVDDKQNAPTRTEHEDEHEEETPTTVAPSARRGRRLGRIVALVAAALLVGGVATAQGGAHVWAHLTALWTDAPEVEVSARTAPPAAPTAPSFASASAISVRPERTPPPSETDEAKSDPPTAPPAIAQAPMENAKTLFDAVSEARRQGDYARALVLHRRLQAEYPRSREAHVSHATIGRLLLDRGDAAAALESFDAYQARGPGALDEAVLIGRATALDRLGRSDEAQASWQALLVAFPETPYAEHARMRTGGARVP